MDLSAMWPSLLAWLLLLGALLTGPVQARVVGLVLDDSGSMTRVFDQARFAIQLLVAALSEQDQLYVARLNGEQGRVTGPIDLTNRQAYLRQIQTEWRAEDSAPTPYQPLDGMLASLAAATPPGQEASLLVITDGEFTNPPVPAEAAVRYQQLKTAFRGRSLDAWFVVLHHKQDLRAIIEKQGLRRELLTALNGSPDAGRVDIDQVQNVFPGLRQVITRLYGSDPASDPGIAAVQAARVTLQPPFSISRLAVIIPAAAGVPARFTGASFSLLRDPPLSFQPAADRTRAHVYHLQPLQPLLPGTTHTLDFSGPLPAGTQVLFDSGLALALTFFGTDGRQLAPDGQGQLTVGLNERIEVRAVLNDPLDPQGQPVRLARLPQEPVFTLHEGNRSRSMAVNRSGDYASAQVSYPAPGQYTLTVVARYPGFITRRAQDITIAVKPVQHLKLTLAAERRDGCAACAPDEARLTYTASTDYRDLFVLTAGAERLPEAGEFQLALADPLPAGVRLLLPDGQTPLTGGQHKLQLEPGRPARLRLQYNRDYREQHDHTLRLSLRPRRADWQGSAELTLNLRPHRPPLQLKAAGHTGPDPDQPFRLAVTDLGQGEGVYVAAEGLLQPLNPAFLELASRTLNFALSPDGPDRVLIIPEQNWWCDCLTRPGDHDFTLRYEDPEGRQSAEYQGAVTLLDAPWWEKCWQELALLAIVLALLAKVWCLLRHDRFPSASRLVVIDLEQPASSNRIRLHSVWSTLLSCRDERRQAEGLLLRATGQGAVIQFSPACLGPGYPGALYFETTGETLRESFEHNGQRDIPWRWGESLKDDQQRREYVLVKDVAKFQPHEL